MEPGAEGGTLHHGAGNIVDGHGFAFDYKFTPGGKIRTGLTVVEYLLADEGPGDGGFAVIAGSRACSAALLLPPAAALTNSSSADKANLPMPRTLSLMEDHTHAVTEVCGKAGDAVSRRSQVFSAQDCYSSDCFRCCGLREQVIFTETCSHGTLPWRGKHQRRALLYKFINGYQSFGAGPHSVEYPEWIRGMKPEQAKVLLAPFGSGEREDLPARL